MTDKRCPHGWLNHADCKVCQLILENEELKKQRDAAYKIADHYRAERDKLALIIATDKDNKLLARQRDTAWAQAHRLALELECLLMDTKDSAVMSKWWDSGMEALSEYQELQPGAKENAEAWAAMRKAGV